MLKPMAAVFHRNAAILSLRRRAGPAVPVHDRIGYSARFGELPPRAALADCLRRGEAPFASHLLYTQPGVLDDLIPKERKQGIEAGLELAKRADATVVYADLGISKGMEWGIKAATEIDRPIEYRSLGMPWKAA